MQRDQPVVLRCQPEAEMGSGLSRETISYMRDVRYCTPDIEKARPVNFQLNVSSLPPATGEFDLEEPCAFFQNSGQAGLSMITCHD